MNGVRTVLCTWERISPDGDIPGEMQSCWARCSRGEGGDRDMCPKLILKSSNRPINKGKHFSCSVLVFDFIADFFVEYNLQHMVP